jgi:hypothetical protein
MTMKKVKLGSQGAVVSRMGLGRMGMRRSKHGSNRPLIAAAWPKLSIATCPMNIQQQRETVEYRRRSASR